MHVRLTCTSVLQLSIEQLKEFRFFHSGIFAYLNYHTPSSRKQIADILINGLRRLEYRGYDSAGIAIDENCPDCNGDSNKENTASSDTLVIRRPGKVAELCKAVTCKKWLSSFSLKR